MRCVMNMALWMPSSGYIGSVPYIAVGNNELVGKLGKTCRCPNCGKSHRVKGDERLNYVVCSDDGESYIVGFGGRRIANT